jgi:hypothetical protein
MNRFDQSARYAAKRLDAVGFLRWLVPAAFSEWAFRDWLDTRTLPFPGEPDRTCDTVAGFDPQSGEGLPVAFVIEFQSEPQGDMLERLAEYILRLRREPPPRPRRGMPYLVAGAILNLTGKAQAPTWEMVPAGFGGAGLRLQVVVRTLREESAAATLAGLAQGHIARCILPWIPLMQRAEEPAILEEWKRLAVAEPEARRRADYAVLALIFAELAGHAPAWRAGLEGWNMVESQVALEWITEGETRGRVATKRADILQALQVRFGPAVPSSVSTAVAVQTDLAVLQRWFDQALTAPTLDAFRAALAPP